MATVSTKSFKVEVDRLTRVEGHGNIVVDLRNGRLEQCDLQIVEAPRFIEAILRGQPYQQVSLLASRICGICAVAHASTSLQAVENALGITPSRQTILLRRLILMAEILDSHILHIYMLVAPDLLGEDSVIPLARTDPELFLRALRMKKVAGDLCALIGGRHTHPIAMTVGGFSHFPKSEDLKRLLERLHAMRDDVAATVEIFRVIPLPEFERETTYIALSKEGDYCFSGGRITSSDGEWWSPEEYRRVTKEYQVVYSTAKHAQYKQRPYMVGALARFNLNFNDLHPKARLAAEAYNLRPKCTNPYKILHAQIVELVHCLEEAYTLAELLIESGLDAEAPVPPARLSGEGVGACEAPRGTLYHHYVIQNGRVKEANCVIPTAQNLANIEADMGSLVNRSLDGSPKEIRLAVEMLVRAYDPCISCATHRLEVNFS